jgi:hypothetical protein
MEIKCAWCDKLIGRKTFAGEDPRKPLVTHSICQSCRKEILQDAQFGSLGGLNRPNRKAPTVLT